MRKVTRFEAEDGEVFTTSEAAEAHDNWLAIQEWYEANKIQATTALDAYEVSWSDYTAWLTSHPEDAQAILDIVNRRNTSR